MQHPLILVKNPDIHLECLYQSESLLFYFRQIFRQ